MADIGDVAGRAVAAGAGGFVAGGPIGALVAVATTLVPDLVRALAGDTAGAAAHEIAGVVQAVAGTEDPVAAAGIFAADAAKVAEARARLLEIQVRAEEARRRDELEAMKASIADVQASRASMVQLANMKHSLAWMPAFQTIAVTIGFFITLTVLLMNMAGGKELPNGVREVLMVLVGILASEFRGACQFWIGGSRAGSIAATATVQQAMSANPAAQAAPEPARRGSIFSRGA